jgi:hypothetical protein
MKSIIILIAISFLFTSCSIFKSSEEYYPDAYQEYYHVSFPYLHNYSNNLELKISAMRDSVISNEPFEIMVELINKSKTDTMYYGYFNKYYDFALRDSIGKIYKRSANRYAIADTIITPRDKYGRPITALFHSTRILYPGDSVVLFNEGFLYSSLYYKKFPNGEYYLNCSLNHMEFDSSYNPIETVINSNEVKFVISSRIRTNIE